MQAITVSEYGGPEKLEYGKAPLVATERKPRTGAPFILIE